MKPLGISQVCIPIRTKLSFKFEFDYIAEIKNAEIGECLFSNCFDNTNKEFLSKNNER